MANADTSPPISGINAARRLRSEARRQKLATFARCQGGRRNEWVLPAFANGDSNAFLVASAAEHVFTFLPQPGYHAITRSEPRVMVADSHPL